MCSLPKPRSHLSASLVDFFEKHEGEWVTSSQAAAFLAADSRIHPAVAARFIEKRHTRRGVEDNYSTKEKVRLGYKALAQSRIKNWAHQGKITRRSETILSGKRGRPRLASEYLYQSKCS